jgi:hypothetical protein
MWSNKKVHFHVLRFLSPDSLKPTKLGQYWQQLKAVRTIVDAVKNIEDRLKIIKIRSKFDKIIAMRPLHPDRT